ncbi:MAG: hypothetical protein CDV28_13016 [Candidatus Electronema aureum]|uniref:Uncharacterized protein n=1 Tax=Candidatus Electronema aureum TaxID=2005002 RepID=A0A521FZY9_9BACT|nr:MAG: hypothetical protein CDV28_13016 [Candidatus Electronema aureum]
MNFKKVSSEKKKRQKGGERKKLRSVQNIFRCQTGQYSNGGTNTVCDQIIGNSGRGKCRVGGEEIGSFHLKKLFCCRYMHLTEQFRRIVLSNSAQSCTDLQGWRINQRTFSAVFVVSQHQAAFA